MKHFTTYGSSLLLAGALCFAASPELTSPEKEKALRYLEESRNELIGATKGMSDAQWKFKPAPDRWSAQEVVEHLVLIENLVHGIAGKMPDAPASPADRDVEKMDMLILAKVPDRSEKVQAPPQATPSGRWSAGDTLQRFEKSRAETESLLRSASGLRGHVIPHPVLGLMDGYEWILATSAHCERHTKQILEVKADPHFPAK